jgi:DedD protein
MISQQQETKDTEIVLGTGKLLVIFFSLVILCGTFFGLGYSVGHSSSPMAIQTGQAGKTSASTGAKPLAGVTVIAPAANNQENAPLAANDAGSPSNAQADLGNTQNQSTSGIDNSANITAANGAGQPDASRNVAPELASESGAITVQVAAVTKQEDAQALVSALRRKNYPVFISSNTASDNLYHVQVGPFAELKDAESMKSKLAGDGYNAIVKK